MDGNKAAHTGRDQQSILGKLLIHNIDSDYAPQEHRYGQLWNMKISNRQQQPYIPGLRIP